MICEIRGTGTHNKGAELMCHVITEQLRATSPDIQFAVERTFGTYEERARYGLRTLLPERGKLGRARLVTKLTRKSFRDQFGLTTRSDLSAVLDASGFAFSDQWGAEAIQYVAGIAEAAKENGKPFILLPQAFGPFQNPDVRAAAKRLADVATLIFPREGTSLRHIHELGTSGSHIVQAHDFTNLSKSRFPEDLDLPQRFACIVPNTRMLDRADKSASNSYVNFLATTVKEVRKHDIEPYFLFHDWKHDSQVANAVDSQVDQPVERLTYHCPMILKGIIARAQYVIGSRFHALVGALCQAVPVLATSWSHKYEELLQEYGVPELLVRPEQIDVACERIVSLSDSAQRELFSDGLKHRAAGFRAESRNMFNLVRKELGLSQLS